MRCAVARLACVPLYLLAAGPPQNNIQNPIITYTIANAPAHTNGAHYVFKYPFIRTEFLLNDGVSFMNRKLLIFNGR